MQQFVGLAKMRVSTWLLSLRSLLFFMFLQSSHSGRNFFVFGFQEGRGADCKSKWQVERHLHCTTLPTLLQRASRLEPPKPSQAKLQRAAPGNWRPSQHRVSTEPCFFWNVLKHWNLKKTNLSHKVFECFWAKKHAGMGQFSNGVNSYSSNRTWPHWKNTHPICRYKKGSVGFKVVNWQSTKP